MARTKFATNTGKVHANMGVKLKRELIAISKNEGFATLTDWIVYELRKARDCRPERSRIYIEDDGC